MRGKLLAAVTEFCCAGFVRETAIVVVGVVNVVLFPWCLW